MRLLVVNAGSTSLKLRVLDDDDQAVASADHQALDGEQLTAALEQLLEQAPDIDAIVHRVVHGGELRDSVIVDQGVLDQLQQVDQLAPLHNRAALAALDRARRLRPELPQVLCFDTAFHATLAAEAAAYAVPAQWREHYGVRRYGFHGLSHAYASRRCAQLMERPPTELRIVSCHLGGGASLAAVAGGRSIDTTMGMTPNDGLVMATRSGSFDPGAMLWLQLRRGLTPEEVEQALEHQSGLLGLSGLSSEMPELLAAAAAGSNEARLAIDVYVHRLRAGIAGMAAAMGGLDALVFTGGVGFRSPEIRARTCAGLTFLGVELDQQRNEASDDREIGRPDGSVRVMAVDSREDLQMAGEARRLFR